jgi:hypothetical protein
MLAVHGGKRYNKSKRGGCGGMWSPAPFDGVGATLPAGRANYELTNNQFGSKQVGGDGYGYADGSDAKIINGSYFPVSRMPSTPTGDSTRGGNNFIGGSRRRRSKKSRGTRRKSRSSKSRGSHKSGGRSKKWRQKGCNTY